jgi:hypothetical protein
VDALILDCVSGTDGGAATCSAFLSDPANEACEACMLTADTSEFYGPIIVYTDYSLLNIGGCIAVVDPCQEACAEAVESNEVCPASACVPACPNNASAAEIASCSDVARTCSCLAEATRTAACAALADDSVAGNCYPTAENGGFAGRAAFMGMLFCGPPTTDASK